VLVNGADQTYRGSLRCLEEKAKRTNYGKSVSHTKLAVVAQRGIDAAVAGASWYPLACCGKMDCFPVACDQLVETGSGRRIADYSSDFLGRPCAAADEMTASRLHRRATIQPLRGPGSRFQ